jgi:nucleotide-binding universal stress UspA family protein
MIQLKKILVPVDFSKGSDNALRYAREFAHRFDAELHLLHVVQEPIGDMDAFYAVPVDYFEQMREEAQRRLEQLIDPKENVTLDVKTTVRSGTPFVEIIRYAKENQIDLIAMGTHGRGAVAHMLMGSVAEKVVRKGPCPVLTVQHLEHEFITP